MKQFITRIKNEAKKSPGKAALLGGLVVVGIYFWIPLLGDWFGGESDHNKSKVKVEKKKAATSQVATQNTTPDVMCQKYKWQEMIAWIEDEESMQPATKLTLGKNPFYNKQKVVVEQAQVTKTDEIEQEDEIIQWTPTNLGLVVTSTMVGPKRSTALINGRVYRLGAKVKVMASKSNHRIEFQLTKIKPKWIELERDGEKYQLKLHTKQSEEDVVIQAGGI